LINCALSEDDINDEAIFAKSRTLTDYDACFDSGVAYKSKKEYKLGKKRNVATAHDCLDLCAETEGCKYWTWFEKVRKRNKRKGLKKICRLLSGVRRKNWRAQKDGAMSGTLLGDCSPSMPTCGMKPQFIVGGTDAVAGSWPWAAILGKPLSGGGIEVWCGGSLIKNDVILTAAHCFDLPDDPTIVRLGDTDITTTSDGQHQDIEIKGKAIIHPQYDPLTVKNDIAILKLKKPVDFSKGGVGTVCLPNEYSGVGKIESLNRQPHIIGWGKLDDDLPTSDVLQEARVPIVATSSCKNSYSQGGIDIDGTSQICAGLGTIDTCAGDSGGPMLSNELSPQNQFAVIGITSFGVQCADTNFPGVYTRVDNYLDWIAENMK